MKPEPREVESVRSERCPARCSACGTTDTFPKHHSGTGVRHLGCCRDNGCMICEMFLRACGNLSGEELTRYMESRAKVPV